MTRDELYTGLSKLSPSLFEEVVFRASIPVEHVSGGNAPQSTRAIEVIRYAQQQNRLEELARILQAVAGDPSLAPDAPPTQTGLIDVTAERRAHDTLIGRAWHAIERTSREEPPVAPPRAVPGSTRPSSAVFPGDPVRIASSILGGDVMHAIGYAEPGTGALRIAAVRRTSARAFDVRVHLLEAVGATYRCIWSFSEDLSSFNDSRILEAEDIDRDGVCELLFSDLMYGTHCNIHSLYIYFPQRGQLFSVCEYFDPSWLPRPQTPSLALDPEPPKDLREIIVEAATGRGFLRLVMEEDLDHPESAMRRWFRDNGHAPSGTIVVHEYDGPPAWEPDASCVLVAGDISWYALFKGPLICYDRRRDRHYVAYAPADRYSCAKMPVWDGASLWFAIHVEDGLGRFHEASKTLQRVEKVGDLVLPEVQELIFDEKQRRLIINGSIEVNPDDVPLLPRF